jgi:hypothetical protein
MEFEGVFSAIVAAVLISFGVGGDWARWTNVRNVSAAAQALAYIPDVPGCFHDNKRGNSSFLLRPASLGKGASPRGGVPTVGFCTGAYHWTFSSVSGSRRSGVTLAGNFSLTDLPDDNTGDILTGESAE